MIRTIARAGRALAAIAVIALAAVAPAPLPGIASTARAQALPPMPVGVAQPVVRTVTDTAEFTGRFASSALVEVRAQVAGTLQSVHFRDGAVVKKGDLLFQIDPRTYQAAVDEARAQLEVARTRLDFARSELTRGQELRQGGSIAESALQQRQQTFLEAQAALQAAQAALKASEINLGFTRIEAPIGGQIGRKLVNEGNIISAGAGAAPLATIVAVDPIHFYFEVDEQSYLRYRRAMVERDPANGGMQRPVPVTLALSDEREFTRPGVIDFADNRLDAQSGTLQLRAVVPNPSGLITPGLFGRVRLEASPPYEALLVPDVAILADQTRKVVMTVDAEGTVVPKLVEPGQLQGHLRVVRGLSPEDKVIVNGLMRARPGGKVIPQPVDVSRPPGQAAAAAPQ
jgi:RND family efflux transporter MFP subunit